MRWEPELGVRFRELLKAIASKYYDSETLIAVKTSETALGLSSMGIVLVKHNQKNISIKWRST